MARLNTDQLAGFRRKSQPPLPPQALASPTTDESTPSLESGPSGVRGQPDSTAARASQRLDSSAFPAPADRGKGAKAVLHLPRPTAGRLRATSEATGYPLSRLVTAAVTESAELLGRELDGGVPLLRRRPSPGREAFTLWLPSSTRTVLKQLAEVGGISASEVATRALEPFLDRFEAD